MIDLKRLKRDAQNFGHLEWHSNVILELINHIEQLEAKQAPDGWQLVPIEPTEKMIDACEQIDWCEPDVRGSCINQWQSMIAAAPKVTE